MGYLAISIVDDVAVAVHRRDRTVDPSVFETSTDLHFADDGTVSLGDDARSGSIVDSPTIRASITRVGQRHTPTDVYRAEDLVAHAVNCLVAMTSSLHDDVVPAVAVVHPDNWGSAEVDLLRGAFDHTGLHGVQFVPNASATRAFAAVDSGAAVGQGVLLAIGALAVLEDARSVDTDDTDALPVVAAPRALAFSEAIPVVYDEPTADEERAASPRRTPLLVVTGLAVAVILASVGIAAALGTFSDGENVAPPAITDAQQPATATTTPAPESPTSTVPLPTVELQAPSEPSPATTALPSAPVPAPAPSTQAAPAPPPLTANPAPEPSRDPSETVPEYLQPGSQVPSNGIPDYLQPGYSPPAPVPPSYLQPGYTPGVFGY